MNDSMGPHILVTALPRPSDQPQPLEAGVAVAADDDVVVDGDAERLCDLDDLASSS